MQKQEIKLYNYADCCKDHYCVGRFNEEGQYNEYYNKGHWCSAGEVFVGVELANQMLEKISLDTALADYPEIDLSVCFSNPTKCQTCSESTKFLCEHK